MKKDPHSTEYMWSDWLRGDIATPPFSLFFFFFFFALAIPNNSAIEVFASHLSITA